MKIDKRVKVNDERVEVTIKLPSMRDGHELVKFMTSDVIKFLEEERDIIIVDVIQSAMVTNTGSDRWLKGTWIFEQKVEQPKPRKLTKPSSVRRTPRKKKLVATDQDRPAPLEQLVYNDED